MIMQVIMKITALCIVGALLILVLKRSNAELGLLLALAATVVVLLFLIEPIQEIMIFLDELAEHIGVPRSLFDPLYKTIGIAFIVKMGGGICRDTGESALASVVETAGAVCALLVALPLLQEVLGLLLELLK